jgi:hypothetical protein
VADAREDLIALTVEAAFAHAKIVDQQMAACCVAGVWLLYDFLDESHEISQAIHNSSGSFWHGIIHRREGDYANAKYWFRQVGQHPIFPDLVQAAQELSVSDGSESARAFQTWAVWDACRFVDLCQAAVQGRSSGESFLCRVQEAEWELLFDHSYRRALSLRPT